MRVVDRVLSFYGHVDHVPFLDLHFLPIGHQNTVVFQHVVDLLDILIRSHKCSATGLHRLPINKLETSGAAHPTFTDPSQLMPAHCSLTIALRRNIAPVANCEFSALALNRLAYHVMLEPSLVHIVKHLVMDPRRQVNRVAILYWKPLFTKEHFATARKNVVHLLEILVLVVVRSLATLQRVTGKTLQPLQAIPLIRIIIALPIAIAAPVHGTQMRYFGLDISPIDFVYHRFYIPFLKCDNLAHPLTQIDEFLATAAHFVD